jgi:hypothetical protein
MKELKQVKYGWAIWDGDENHFEWNDDHEPWSIYKFYEDAKRAAKNLYKNAKPVRVKYTKTMTILSRVPDKKRRGSIKG